MQELAKLLRYTPGPGPGGAAGDRAYPSLQPVAEYMKAKGVRVLQEYHLEHMEFWE